MLARYPYILLAAAVAIVIIIFINSNSKAKIDAETLRHIETDRAISTQEEEQRQFLNLIMFQQIGYLFAFILIPIGFSIYQNRTTLKRYKNKFDNAFKTPSIVKRKTFTERLIIKYPQLTNNDIDLCKLVYTGLSSKEISKKLNISPSSVNTARYRLRKKLNIPPDEELINFLRKI